MDVELVFEGGTAVRTYDRRYETPGSIAANAKLDGWVEIGNVVFHARRLLCIRWVDPIKEVPEP